MYIGERKQRDNRNTELNDNKSRDCFEIIQTVTGFRRISECQKLQEGQPLTAYPEWTPYDQMVPQCGIPREYFECLRQNDKLKEQRIVHLTARLFQLTKR